MRQRRNDGPHPVDIQVGSRLKQRRTALGISQQELATSQGVTFQQVQKYERGLNRISASRLYHLSEALTVPVTFFFEGITGTSTTAPPASGDFTDPLDTSEAAELSAAYQRIADPMMRRRLLDLAQSLGPKQSTTHPRRSGGRIRSRSARSHRARDR
jgi:transcriptional regulator with XRE-family HTH domain